MAALAAFVLSQARGGHPMVPLGLFRSRNVSIAVVGGRHWHGAAHGHFMTHLSLTEGDTERGDHVTGAEYNSDRGGAPAPGQPDTASE